MTPTAPASRPGGRTARVRAAVLDAADRFLACGREPVTVRMLAERSGVSEPTIYRRWRTAENVLVDAAVRTLTEQSPAPATGDLRADLIEWASSLERSIATASGHRFLAVLIRARTSEPDSTGLLAPFMEARVDQLQALLGAGDAAPSLTVGRLLDHVLAPLYVRQLLGYTSTATAEDLVDEFLAHAAS